MKKGKVRRGERSRDRKAEVRLRKGDRERGDVTKKGRWTKGGKESERKRKRKRKKEENLNRKKKGK